MLFSAGRLSRWPSRGHEGRANADASSLYLSHQIPSICSAMRSQKVDCPVCKTERLSMMERQGIEIDYCPKCRGVWLDRGELDKIVERSAMESTATAPLPVPAAPQFPSATPEHGHGGHLSRQDDRDASGHRRKSFLRDLFD